jgi:hypothetical protein
MPKLKISMLFFHTTLGDDRNKRALSTGMLVVSQANEMARNYLTNTESVQNHTY